MDQAQINKILSFSKKYRVQTRLDMGFDMLTTIGTGGKIGVALFPDTLSKLVKTLRMLKRLCVSTVVLGRGSNVLASDRPFDGAVVVTVKANKFTLKGRRAVAQCGASTVALARALANKGLSGGEFLSCLPATVGGATVGNAGCFGEDMKGIVRSVTVFENGKIRRISAQNCKFAMRDSVFKHSGGVVLAVKMRFSKSTPRQVRALIAEMRDKKAQTQPLNARSAGCVLYHDIVAVSRLIDEMGLKGYTVGGAQVSTKHAGFVVNIDKSTSLDIYLIIQYLKTALWQRYGLRAKTEVRLINFAEDEDDFFSKRQK